MNNTLTLYRNLLKYSKSLPKAKRTEAYNEIRITFRKNRNVTNENEISTMLQRATSTLGYLKIVTPKRIGLVKDSYITKISFGGDSSRLSKAVTNWSGTF